MMNSVGPFAVILIAVFSSNASTVQILEGNYGCFASPNYPSNYPHDINQRYRIVVRPGSRIKITFITFMLEQESSCRYDYLQIREKDGSVSRKLCGHNNPGEIISLDNELRLEFKSDQSVNSLGFFAAFQMTNDSSPTQSPSPPPACQPEVHTSPSGDIKSPGYPKNYHSNANCIYNITVQDGKRIKIDFSTFDVEADAACRFDKLMIFEGDSMAAIAVLCGRGSKAFTSRSNKLLMRFTSDGSVTGRGFFGRYRTIDKPKGGGATVNDPSCGIRRVSQSRVIGGTDAKKGDWPWQVGMYFYGRFICGGTLIAPNWVLTASHCVVSRGRVRRASSFDIVAGDLHRSLNDTMEQKHQVELVIPHHNYDRRLINNDIALMKLKTPVMMNDYVLTACIPNKTDIIAVGSTCFITGWGKIQHPGNAHTMLQQAMLPVLNSTFCQSKIDKLGWGLKITDQMVCAGEVGSKKSGCHGDSGGPFVCPDKNGRFYLHGDVSWGSRRCDTSQAYTVFARVTEFVDWIKDTLRDN